MSCSSHKRSRGTHPWHYRVTRLLCLPFLPPDCLRLLFHILKKAKLSYNVLIVSSAIKPINRQGSAVALLSPCWVIIPGGGGVNLLRKFLLYDSSAAATVLGVMYLTFGVLVGVLFAPGVTRESTKKWLSWLLHSNSNARNSGFPGGGILWIPWEKNRKTPFHVF